MEQLTGRSSKAMFGVSFVLMVAGAVFLLWGEGADLLWVFIDGLIITAAGVACYYMAGEFRILLEARYRRLTKSTKFALLLVSCSPWVVMYFFISPLWDAILVAIVTPAGCAGYVWLYPRLRGARTEAGLEHDRVFDSSS